MGPSNCHYLKTEPGNADLPVGSIGQSSTDSESWVNRPIIDGLGVVRSELHSWKYFSDFVYQEMLDYTQYIWRGQRCDDWALESTLDRALRNANKSLTGRARQGHLDGFRYAVRGRRGPTPPPIEEENDWWALGQHHGLATPLLDWTHSPFAAAYFAFIGEGAPQTRCRAIYGLSQSSVEAVNKKKLQLYQESNAAYQDSLGVPPRRVKPKRPSIVEFVRPLADDNPRLVNQSALFTRAPDGASIEEWVQANFAGMNEEYVLIKVTIPNKDRALCLRSLNRMNINHLTLFPDVYGASRFCNLHLEVPKY